MPLVEFRIENLRCVEHAELELSSELNLICGPNGAGKTSVLEAAFLLGRGRSFRTRTSEKLIRHGQQSLVVFGRTTGGREDALGVQVTREGTRARINGAPAETLLSLSSSLPIQAIDPDIHKLIDQGPERRRRWLDWLVFHVEPTFGAEWAKYQRALKQRNAALKARADFRLWEPALVQHGEAITEARVSALQRLAPYLQPLLNRFPGLDVTAGFHSGWAQGNSFADALRLNTDRDLEKGTTTSGAHRADVVLRYRGRSARETLSRGQQKLTAVAMILAQLKLLKGEFSTRATLLLDDPAAELDALNLSRMFEELAALECQTIATSLDPEITLFQAPNVMFHVEHGRVFRV